MLIITVLKTLLCLFLSKEIRALRDSVRKPRLPTLVVGLESVSRAESVDHVNTDRAGEGAEPACLRGDAPSAWIERTRSRTSSTSYYPDIRYVRLPYDELPCVRKWGEAGWGWLEPCTWEPSFVSASASVQQLFRTCRLQLGLRVSVRWGVVSGRTIGSDGKHKGFNDKDTFKDLPVWTQPCHHSWCDLGQGRGALTCVMGTRRMTPASCPCCVVWHQTCTIFNAVSGSR